MPESQGTGDTISCPVCGSRSTRLRHADVRDFEYSVEPAGSPVIRSCSSCSSEFLFPRPGADGLVAFYPPDYHAYNEDHGPVARRLVGLRAAVRGREYRRLMNGRPGRLFDVGAGDCRHFDELDRYCDLQYAGVELNHDVAEVARERGYDVVDGTLEAMDMTGRAGAFDIVSMNHVLEHVIEPRLVVERAFELLRPGGHLLGQLPSTDSWEAHLFGRRWAGYHYPRHLQMFSRAGLARILGSGGFERVTVRTAPHIQSAISAQNALMGAGWKPRIRYGKSGAYSALLVAVAPFEVLAYAFDRGGIVNFSARKPAT